MKICCRCSLEKKEEEFSKLRKSKDGLCGMCKDCDITRRKRTYKRNKIKEIHLTDTQSAYLAGLLDGDGYIGITNGIRKTGKYIGNICYHSRVVIGITTPIIHDIQQEYKIGKVYESKARSVKHKDRYDWVLSSNEIRAILPQVAVFLKIKKIQAEFLLEYLRLAYTARDREGIYRSKVNFIYAKLRELNKRGV